MTEEDPDTDQVLPQQVRDPLLLAAMAEAHLEGRRHQEAAAAFEELTGRLRGGADRAAFARALEGLGRAHRGLGHEALAASFLQAARRVAAEAPSPCRKDSEKFMLGPQGPALLRMLNRILDSGLALESLLDLAIGLVMEQTAAERGFFMLTEEAAPRLKGRSEFLYARHIDHAAVEEPAFAVSRGIIATVTSSRRAVLIEDATGHPEFRERLSVQRLGLHSVLCVPVPFFDTVLAVVYLEHRQRVAQFNPQHLELLEHFCDRLAGLVQGLLAHRERLAELEAENQAYQRSLQQLARKYALHQLIGVSEPMQKVYATVERVAGSDVNVLIEGESGTGKELVARALHFNSKRRDRPLLAINCLALSDDLLETELFGYVKGAFTGAVEDRQGLFEQAHGGTLFLDELAGISPQLQGALLRVLAEGEVRPLGTNRPVAVDVRVLAAVNRDLEALVRAGEFREDLFYRLKVVQVRLPALRERKADLPYLVDHFLKLAAEKTGRAPKTLTPEALRHLYVHSWPGNVRELKNYIYNLVLMHSGDMIEKRDIAFDDDAPPVDDPRALVRYDFQSAKRAFAAYYAKALLERNQGNVSAAARESGMQRWGFQRLLKSLEPVRPDARPQTP